MDDIYVVTAHYDSGESYEFHYEREDIVGAYESEDFAKNAINYYFESGGVQNDYFDGREIREVFEDTEDSWNWEHCHCGYRIFELDGIDHENDNDPYVTFYIAKIGFNSPITY